MRVRQHTAAPNGRCLWCGAAQVPAGGYGERTCVEREDGICRLAPEPKRRELAHEDATAISARVAELRREQAHAWSVQHCAAKAGRPKSECHQCGPAERCQACARARGEAIPQCPLCWHAPTKPCPT